ncbi:MAG: HlyC/CorC family transporter [Lachnospiraceae bacterium]|nr:HlyC/CorC family transporter [Lachnospiraceae bacterium]
MEENNPWSGIIVFLCLLILNYILHGFGGALNALSSNKIEETALQGDKQAKKLQYMLEYPCKFRNTIQVLATLSSIVIGTYTLTRYSHMFQQIVHQVVPLSLRIEVAVSWGLTGIMGIILLLVFGVVVPERLAMRSAEKFAYSMLPIVSFFMVILTPLTGIINFFAGLVLKGFGININENPDDLTEEEILSMVNEGHEQGVLEAREVEMISNIFEMGDKEAQDVMTHRINVIAVDGNSTLREALDFMLDGNKSRYPVYDEDLDDIIGILHLRDAFNLHKNKELLDKKVKEIDGLIREAKFIPETKNIHELFKGMQNEKLHMVIVIDEYGQVSGLVALEDILEEIVGNIMDEYDEEEESITKLEDESFIMDGMTELEEVEEVLGIEIEEDFDTLNGLLVSKLEHIPKEDEMAVIEYKDYEFTILSIDNKKIGSVKVKKKACQ